MRQHSWLVHLASAALNSGKHCGSVALCLLTACSVSLGEAANVSLGNWVLPPPCGVHGIVLRLARGREEGLLAHGADDVHGGNVLCRESQSVPHPVASILPSKVGSTRTAFSCEAAFGAAFFSFRARFCAALAPCAGGVSTQEICGLASRLPESREVGGDKGETYVTAAHIVI
jgi:hypothetical protein